MSNSALSRIKANISTKPYLVLLIGMILVTGSVLVFGNYSMNTAQTPEMYNVSPSNYVPDGHIGILQFKSNFEANTFIYKKNKPYQIRGIDYSVGYGTNNDWDQLGKNLPWMKLQNWWSQGGNFYISNDPLNSENKVLHFHNTEKVKGVSRGQWSMQVVDGTQGYWTDDGTPNLFEQQFYRYRMFIPVETSNAFSYKERAGWYMIWESSAWPQFPEGGENTRYVVGLRKYPNSGTWIFSANRERPAVNVTNEYYWDNCGKDWWTKCVPEYTVPVPFGKWFTLEVFFKYHETDGEFYIAMQEDGGPRKIIGHLIGQTKYDKKLHDQMIFKMYHKENYIDRVPGGTHQYYDDLEIWSGYPPGYWGEDARPQDPEPPTNPLPSQNCTFTGNRTMVVEKGSNQLDSFISKSLNASGAPMIGCSVSSVAGDGITPDNCIYLKTTYFNNTNQFRSLIGYDLSDIREQDGIKIDSASLQLYTIKWDGVSVTDNNLTVARLLKPVNYKSANWNLYDTAQSWGLEGATKNVNPNADYLLTSSAKSNWGKVNVNVTNLMNDWYTNTEDNQIDLLLFVNKGRREFASREYSDPVQRPKLTVTYSCDVTP